MRILFITRKFPPAIGGMETFSAQFAEAFGQDGNVIAMKGSQLKLVWWLPWQLIRLPWIVRAYDVVHLGDGVLTILAFWLRIWSAVPVTVTLHGLDVTYKNEVYQWYIRSMLRYCRGIVAVSNYTKSVVLERLPNAPVTVIGHGVTFDGEPEVILGTQPDNETHLLTVGRLVSRKGVAWFIENVWPALPETYQYTIVGEGEDNAKISSLIRALPQESQARIHMLGRIDQASLDAAFKAADVFVMPNQAVEDDVEGFGIVALEAQLFGLPVAASALEGITDALVDGVTGLLVHSNTVEAWKKAIFTCKSMQKSTVYAEAKQHFDWQVIHQQYVKFFQNIQQ